MEGVTVDDVVVFDKAEVSELGISGAKLVGGGEIIQTGNSYLCNLTKKNTYIDFGLTGATANDVVFTKKIIDGDMLSYGFVKIDEQVDGVPGIGYYIFAYCSTDAKWAEIPDVTTTDYTIYYPTLGQMTEVHIEGRKNSAIESA
jgi:hypothetical protein